MFSCLVTCIVMHCGTDVVASLQHTPLRSAQRATVEDSSTSCTQTSSKQQYTTTCRRSSKYIHAMLLYQKYTTTCRRSNKYIHAMLLYQTNTWSFFPAFNSYVDNTASVSHEQPSASSVNAAGSVRLIK